MVRTNGIVRPPEVIVSVSALRPVADRVAEDEMLMLPLADRLALNWDAALLGPEKADACNGARLAPSLS
jgi:hypothetical protein